MKRTANANALAFTVPLIPPSANRYVRHARDGRHYRTAEARAWDAAVAACSSGLVPLRECYSYIVHIELRLAKGQRLDADNAMKCTLDACQRARLITSDAAVSEIHLIKLRDGSGSTRIMIETG